LGAEVGGFAFKSGESSFEGEFAGVELIGGDEPCRIIAGAVDSFACGESFEGLGDIGSVLAESVDPEGEGREVQG